VPATVTCEGTASVLYTVYWRSTRGIPAEQSAFTAITLLWGRIRLDVEP
jgi:hypothetical protein